MQLFLMGIFLGWGAAIPIGPMNLEIMRRHLRYGLWFGLVFGLGACIADLTYLLLLSIGILNVINQPLVLKTVGIIGSLILFWFGINAFRMPVGQMTEKSVSVSLWRNGLEAYSLTLLNPFTILFWASVSSQISLLASNSGSVLLLGCGVMVGTTSWILFLNGILHHIRHRISDKFIHYLNCAGGVIVMGFAVFGIIYALSMD